MTDDVALLPLPEGFSLDEVSDLAGFARSNPQRCMMFIDETMKYTVKDVRRKWLSQARMLYFVKEKDLWQHHPAGFTSFFGWCSQPEIEIHPSTVSDMLAVIRFAPQIQEKCDTNLFDLIEEVGHSSVRQLIPAIRKAYRNDTMSEEVTPLLDEIRGSSFREVLAMRSPGGQRTGWDPEARYREVEDPETKETVYELTFTKLDFDALELLATKTGLKRWYDSDGRRSTLR